MGGIIGRPKGRIVGSRIVCSMERYGDNNNCNNVYIRRDSIQKLLLNVVLKEIPQVLH